MRVAVIDCGTNTVRLLIADGTGDGLADVTRQLRFTRLGQGVDATGSFNPEALARTLAAVGEYASIIADSGVDKVRFVATSAARDVSNRDQFFAGVRDRLGVEPEVIAGTEEAELSFLGALAGGPLTGSPILVVDIGGGSTELIRGTQSGQVEAEVSLNMGSVRIRERFLLHDPPLAPEITAARQFIDGLLDNSGVELDNLAHWIGVAGTATSLSAMNIGLTTYDRATVDNSTIPRADLDALAERLITLSVADTMQVFPSLQPMRAEVIVAGAMIASAIAARTGRDLLVRETDILDGAALRLIKEC